MGLARKIAFTGIGSVVALVAVILIAQKTDILNKITSGLGNLGSSLGSGFGIGTRNAGAGFLYGLGGGIPPIDDQGIAAPNVIPDPRSGFSGTAGNFGKDFADWLTQLFKLGIPNPLPPADALPATGNAINVALAENLKFSSSSSANARIPSKGGVRYTGSSSNPRPNEGRRYSRGSAATQARRTAGARRAASKRAGKCYNTDLSMGGVQEIRARQFGVVPMHG